uniref:Kringle domain-containing protein n=1 Tax=Parastrongyloides trichosuri TaxID=131310 RepID=A0A0N4ZUW2_PARTI
MYRINLVVISKYYLLIVGIFFKVHCAYYEYTDSSGNRIKNLYFDPSNYLEGDCIKKEAQPYYYYFGRRNRNYQHSFIRNKCTSWENVRTVFTNKIKFYKKSKKQSDREKVKDLNLDEVEWGSSGYWKHNECRSVRLPRNHPYSHVKGVWNENITHQYERINANEKFRAGWNFGPWCFVLIGSPSLRGHLTQDKQHHSRYLNTSLNTDYYPMACLPICMGKGEKRPTMFGIKKQKTNMIFNRKDINNINRHFYKSFHFGMMQYYRRTSDLIHSSDDFITFYKISMWAGFLIILITIAIVFACYKLDKYDEQLERGDDIMNEVKDDLDQFFEFQRDEVIEEEKENLRNTLLKCQGIQIKRLVELEEKQKNKVNKK